MRFRTLLAAVVVLALATSWTSVALADESATVKLGGGWIALGVGANWGDGVLTFAGYQYPFSIKGLSLGDFGAAGFTASGKVRVSTAPRTSMANAPPSVPDSRCSVTDPRSRCETSTGSPSIWSSRHPDSRCHSWGPASRWRFPRAASRQVVRSGLSNVRARRIRDCHGYAV